MNIVVFTNNSLDHFFKPDNTLVRDSKDFFPPSFVAGLSISLAIGIRISRPCKYTKSEFAGRYYTEWGPGILIYPQIVSGNSAVDVISNGKALGLDNTAYITEKLHTIGEMENNNSLNLVIDSKLMGNSILSKETILRANKLIEEVTRYSSLKSGDVVYMEISDRIPVAMGSNIKVAYSGETSLEFSIR